MEGMSSESRFLVCLVAAAVPLLLAMVPRLRVPSVVLEIEAATLAVPRLRTAVQGYALTRARAVPVAVLATALDCVSSPALLVVVLSATSSGLVVPVLADAQQRHR